MTVAHKYGLMDVRNQGFQLHHYGIVFHPVKPYLLGVMSKGDGGKDLRELLGSISGIVYNHVDEFSKKTEDLLYFDII